MCVNYKSSRRGGECLRRPHLVTRLRGTSHSLGAESYAIPDTEKLLSRGLIGS
jgi:hypothetical protein